MTPASPAQQPHHARSEASSPPAPPAPTPSGLQRLRAATPPVSVILLAAAFVFAGWFTLFGPIGILAWRGGTFPPTEPDRPYYQQALKDVARYQYQEQPSPSIYFGLACGASRDDLRAAIPQVGSHPDSDANPDADPVAAAAAAASMPGAEVAAGVRNSRTEAKTAAARGDLDPRLDAFGHEVDCSQSWTAPFLSFLLASAGVPLYADPAFGSATDTDTFSSTKGASEHPRENDTDDGSPTTANAWLVTDVNQLIQAFKDRNAYVTDPSFSPQVGDVVFYKHPAGQGIHANMVVAVTGDWVTIGGDEHGRVGLASMTLRNRGGVIGYGATGLFEHAPLPATQTTVASSPR